MNDLKDLVSSFNLRINKCKYCKNIRIVDTDKGQFVIKKNKNNNSELYRYLQTKNFNNFLNLYDYNSYYEIYPYIDEITLSNEEKAIDIIYLISILHNRTTFYKNIELDTIKAIYEDINNKLSYLTNYYDNLRMVLEESRYPSPSNYLLLRNISVVFRSIDSSKYFIDRWYNTIKDKESFRVVTIHNSLELDHLLKSDDTYLISWDKSCRASPIYDLLSFYKNAYDKVEFSSLFEMYNSKCSLSKEEIYLLFSLLLVPNKVELSNTEIINTKEVYKLTNYLITTTNFISKYNPDGANKETH